MVNYAKCMAIVRAKCRCTTDEAWSAVNEAFLSLDRSRPESQQEAYLQWKGRLCFYDELRRYYRKGVKEKALVSLDCLKADLDSSVLAEMADDTDSGDYSDGSFLSAFPEGPVREYARALASGHRVFTYNGARAFLRSRYHINKRSTSKEVLHDTRICAERLLQSV